MLARAAKLLPIRLELVILLRLEILAIGAATVTAYVSALARHPAVLGFVFLLVYAAFTSNSL